MSESTSQHLNAQGFGALGPIKCIPVTGSSCENFVADLDGGIAPIKLHALPSFNTQDESLSSFDIDKYVNELTDENYFREKYGCPSFTSSQLRYPRSFSCAHTAISSGSLCARSVPHLISSNTCNIYLQTLNDLLSRCGTAPTFEIQELRTKAIQDVASSCGTMSAADNMINVEIAVNDELKSCGFGMKHLDIAKQFCNENPSEQCCSYLATSVPSAAGNAPNEPQESGNVQRNRDIVLGTVLGVLGLLLLVGGLLYLNRRRRKREQEEAEQLPSPMAPASPKKIRPSPLANIKTRLQAVGDAIKSVSPTTPKNVDFELPQRSNIDPNAVAIGVGAATAGVMAAAVSGESMTSASASSGELYTVIHKYDKKFSDELQLNVGDEILIVYRFDDGWGKGQNLSRGRVWGVCPMVCLAKKGEAVLQTPIEIASSDKSFDEEIVEKEIHIVHLQPEVTPSQPTPSKSTKSSETVEKTVNIVNLQPEAAVATVAATAAVATAAATASTSKKTKKTREEVVFEERIVEYHQEQQEPEQREEQVVDTVTVEEISSEASSVSLIDVDEKETPSQKPLLIEDAPREEAVANDLITFTPNTHVDAAPITAAAIAPLAIETVHTTVIVSNPAETTPVSPKPVTISQGTSMTFDSSTMTDDEMNRIDLSIKGKKINKEEYEVIHPYSKQATDEVTLNLGDVFVASWEYDDGWLRGFNANTGVWGVAPKICMTVKDDKEDDHKRDVATSPLLSTKSFLQRKFSNAGEGEKFIVIHGYTKKVVDELTINVGDSVVVFKQYDDGWGKAKNLTTSHYGVCPMVCLRAVNTLDQQSLSSPSLNSTRSSSSTTKQEPKAPVRRMSFLKQTSSSVEGERYVVVHEYVRKADDELNLRLGDEILVVKKFDDGWSKAKNGERWGVCPMVCLRPSFSTRSDSTASKSE